MSLPVYKDLSDVPSQTIKGHAVLQEPTHTGSAEVKIMLSKMLNCYRWEHQHVMEAH